MLDGSELRPAPKCPSFFSMLIKGVGVEYHIVLLSPEAAIASHHGLSELVPASSRADYYFSMRVFLQTVQSSIECPSGNLIAKELHANSVRGFKEFKR